MTINSTAAVSGPYTATGGTQEFPFYFNAVSAAEVQVRVNGGLLPLTAFSIELESDGTGTATATLLAGDVVYVESAPDFLQEAQFSRFAPYFPDALNPHLDRAAARDIVLRDAVDRAPQAPRDGSAVGKFASIGPDGGWLFASGTGADGALRTDLGTNGGPIVGYRDARAPAYVQSLGDMLPALNLASFFGIKSDNSTDDSARVNFAMEAISNSTNGAGELRFAPGASTLVTDDLIVRPGVDFNINQGRIRAVKAGGDGAGLLPLSNSTIRNGEIVVESSGAAGIQAGVHAPIRLGALYGVLTKAIVDDVNHPLHPFVDISGVQLLGLKLSSNKDVLDSGNRYGAVGVQVMGNVHHCRFIGIEIPDSPLMFGGVHLDWSDVGALSVLKTNAAQSANKAAWNAGTKWSTHPHHIQIWDLFVGALSRSAGFDLSSHGVRLSGCYEIDVGWFDIIETRQAALKATGGDLAFEFAKDFDRQFAYQGIRFHDGIVRDARGGFGGQADTEGDNITEAILNGYDPLHASIWSGDIGFRDVYVRSTSGGSDGFRFENIDGAFVQGGGARGFTRGVAADTKVKNVKIDGVEITSNVEEGIAVYGTVAPQDVKVIDNRVYANGKGMSAGSGKRSGIRVGASTRVTVRGNTFGIDGAYDTTQNRGVDVAPGAAIVDLTIRDNDVRSTSSDGIAYSIMASTDFNRLRLYSNNGADTTKTGTFYSGVTMRPTLRTQGQYGEVTRWDANRSASRAGAIVKRDDEIIYSDVLAGGFRGEVVTTGGTIGTDAVTKTFGSVSA